MANRLRILNAFVIAALINLMLFATMERMASNRISGLDKQDDMFTLDFISQADLPPPPPPPPTRQKPPEPEPEEPVETPRPQLQLKAPAPSPLARNLDAIEIPMQVMGKPFLGNLEMAPDGPVFKSAGPAPTVHVPPQYPQRALQKSIEGYVEVEFTITKEGTTDDIKIIKAKPPRIFNRAAVRAVKRWRYDPQKENGQIVERRNKITIEFSMKDLKNQKG